MPPRDTSVYCPGCGSTTVDHGPGHKPSRWHCARLTCTFRRGWRLELARHHHLDPVDGENTVYAIPVTTAGTLLVEAGVLWPSVIASAGRVLLGTDRQAA